MACTPDLVIETTWWREGYKRVAGVDEAGRGALFGPVAAAAVVFPVDWDVAQVPGLADSKLLSPAKRERLCDLILSEAEAVAVGIMSSAVVDEVGIVPATVRAMSQALESLGAPPDIVIVDGRGPLPTRYRACAFVRGDALCASVAAASIVAKVTRDRLIYEMAAAFPDYGLERNKGYGTPEHLAALARFGPSPSHRHTFAPVALAHERHKPQPRAT